MLNQKALARAALIVVLLVIGWMTLWPDATLSDIVAETPVWCLVCGRVGTIDVVWNALLFLPLGMACSWMGWGWRRTALLGAGVSLVVESLQFFILPGRDASLSDLLTNFTGAIIGWWLAGRFAIIFTPEPSTSRRLFYGSLTLWLVATSVIAWGSAPLVSERPYYGQWTPRFLHLEVFTGAVLDATVVDLPLEQGPFEDSDLVRQRLRRGTGTLRVLVRSGNITGGQAPVASLADDRPTTLLRLSQDGRRLIFYGHTRIGGLRLRTPAVFLDDAFPTVPGIETEFGGAVSRASLSAWAADHDGRRERIVAVSPHWLWFALFPFDIALGATAPLLTGLWLLGVLTPIAYWATRAGTGARSNRPWLILGLGVLTGMVLIPKIAGLYPASWLEWLGTVAGIALGTGMGKRNSRRRRRASLAR